MVDEHRDYLDRSQRYWKQALEHLEKGERGKVTELIWGSIIQSAKALALIEGKNLRQHREVRGYIKALAANLNDPELFELFKQAEAWHANFYEEFMDNDEVIQATLKAQQLLEKFQRLLSIEGI